MRGIVVAVVAIAAAFLAADFVWPPFAGLQPGSVTIEPSSQALEMLPRDEACETGYTEEPCQREYGFVPNAELIVWVSVRNDGPLAVTLRGVSDAWLELYADIQPLAKPVAGLDAGGTEHGVSELRPVPFEPVVLEPGDERIVGGSVRHGGPRDRVLRLGRGQRTGFGLGDAGLELALRRAPAGDQLSGADFPDGTDRRRVRLTPRWASSRPPRPRWRSAAA